jgi:uncharacterized membrane protein YedE/YeeE
MQSFSIINGAGGGVLIGLAATLLLVFVGRVAGISGIIAGLLTPKNGGMAWRAMFLAGLVLGGVLTPVLFERKLAFTLDAPLAVIIVGGFLVGFGTRMGSGCTSGHGVCGMARFSVRSIAATATFMLSGMITVFIIRHIIGS